MSDCPLSVCVFPRTRLPREQVTSDNFSVWSVLKSAVGKELTKITMPVVFNEPLSFLQRVSEYMEYSHLLQAADQQQDSVARMQVRITETPGHERGNSKA